MSQRITRSLISLSGQSIAYGMGIFGRQVVIYLALPLFTNSMSREDFGVVSVTTAFLAFTDVLSNAGLPAATFRLYNDSKDPEIRQLTLGSAQLLIAFYALIATVILLIAANPLSQWLLGDVTYAPIIRIVAVLLFSQSLVNYGNILLRIQVRPLASSIHTLLQIMAQIGLALLLVRGYNLGARGYWLGYLGGGILGLGLMLWLVRKLLALQVSGQRLKEMAAYGLPLIPATLALWALRLIDRALVGGLAGLNEVAVYEIGYKIGLLVTLVISPFTVAWPQFAFEAMHKPDAPNIYRITLSYITASCIFLALGVITFQTDLVYIMAPSTYAAATSVVPWVALSQIAWGMYPILSIGLKITKHTFHIAAITVLAAIVNIVLNVMLIPVLGIQGAAIATLVAYVMLAGMTYLIAQRFYAFPLDWTRLGKLALAGGLTALLVLQLDQFHLTVWNERALRAIGLLIFPVLLVAMGFITPNQYRSIWQTGTTLVRERLGRI